MERWEQVYFIIGSVLTAWWFFLYFRGARRYKELKAAAGEKLFMKDFFGIGYCFLNLIHYRCDTSARLRQIRTDISDVAFGRIHVFFYSTSCRTVSCYPFRNKGGWTVGIAFQFGGDRSA